MAGIGRFFLLRLLLLLSAVTLGSYHARAYDMLCRNGSGSFQAQASTGVRVSVGPPIHGNLALRSCRALLSWNGQELLVAGDAAQVDLDIFGVDLGTGSPVAAFQIKQSEAECCMNYEIYTLEKPPRRLRTLRGGGYFSAADSYFNGQVEIWTDDAGAVDGLEGFYASQMTFPPTSVLRFEDGRLLDVSAEFQSYFDNQISQLRTAINPQAAEQFKLTDGRLAALTASADRGPGFSPLLTVKLHILELVWAYLYSNRPKQAWQTLAAMWPTSDLDRIRAAIIQARARGMRAQLDGVSEALPAPGEPEHSRVYDSATRPARPIMVRFYPVAGMGPLSGRLRVNLVVDCAGKVWSVKVSGKQKAAFNAVKRSSANWKFIPAFLDDQPVASRVRMTISLEQ